MTVRREVAVAFEHPGRDQELDVPPDVGRMLDNVRGALCERAENGERGLSGLPRVRGGDVDFEHCVDDLGPIELPATLRAQTLDMRQQVELRILGHPVALQHGGSEPVEIGYGRRRRRDAPAALVDVPTRSHGPTLCPASSPTARPTMARVLRVPLHSGSKLPLVSLPDDAQLLNVPPPLDPIADVAAAVAEALLYPLAGEPLRSVAPRSGRATVVVQPPELPLPGVDDDPRRDALAAVLEELGRAGVPRERVTVLVAGGLGRRLGRRELEHLLRPDRARDFRGEVVVHDCEADDLRPVAVDDRTVRVHPALVETDLVVTVGAAETVSHGGAAALVSACAAGAIRASRATSLLEPAGSPGWRLGASLEAELRRSVPVVGLSLVLDRPRTAGLYRGYPWDAEARRAIGRSPFRRLLNAMPDAVRRRLLDGVSRQLHVVAALAGPPSVAHAEALVRGTAVRSVVVDGQFDTVVVPLPWESLTVPREPLNPITAASIGLGHVLGLWRNRPALADGGTVVLMHPFPRVMGHGSQAPYRPLFAALREGLPGSRLGGIEAAAARDRRAIAAYRTGAAPHPRRPFADWDSCAAMLERAGRVIVAGCRDAGAARALGLVPSHNAATALAMAHGVAGDSGRTAVLLGPPYPAVVVGG